MSARLVERASPTPDSKTDAARPKSRHARKCITDADPSNWRASSLVQIRQSLTYGQVNYFALPDDRHVQSLKRRGTAIDNTIGLLEVKLEFILARIESSRCSVMIDDYCIASVAIHILTPFGRSPLDWAIRSKTPTHGVAVGRD